MKTVSIREAQHRFSAIMNEVERGNEVAITRRGDVIGRIIPAIEKPKEKLEWPDSEARLKELFPDGPLPGKPLSEMVRDGRGER